MTPTTESRSAPLPSTGVQTRFALLLGLLLAGFLASFLFIRHLEHAEAAQLLADARQQHLRLLEHWLQRTERSLRTFTADTTRHEAVARLFTSAPPAGARAPLATLLANSDAHLLWVLTPEGAPLLAVARTAEESANPALPLPVEELRGLLDGARPPHVFAEQDGRIVELCGEPISGPVKNAPPLGWLLVARRWGTAHLATLASLTEADVRLFPPETAPAADQGTGTVAISRALPDWHGRTLRQVVVRRETPELALLLKSDAWQARVFIVFGLLVLTGLGLALHRWVLRPLAAIRESLARNDPAPLAPLHADTTELGAIATLVADSFARRDALRREVEERTRAELSLRQSQEELRRTLDERASLARDLHDGVIQSLYAAGMGLAGIRALLKPGQEEASVRLEQSRAALNETIRDVRNFITGLEPEALRAQSFAQAVTALLEFMQSVRMFRPVIAIDDPVAARLSLNQRVHALQIAREAVSNALRHGEAPEISVSLQSTDTGIVFEVRDNGRGFVPGATPRTPGSGHGLANFTRRAREVGAELVLHTELGHGTTVRLIFPPLS